MYNKTLNMEQQRYKRLAYVTVRDAIAFYFGIPEFLKDENLTDVFARALQEKINTLQEDRQRELTQKELIKCFQSVRKSLRIRVKELEEDLVHCENVLFHDNIWLQLLDVEEDFFKVYLSRLDSDTKRALAVIPKWGTRDHSLGRVYINDNFDINQGFK